MKFSFQSLDSKLNWELFDSALPISDEDLAKIKYLSVESACSLWSEVFGHDRECVMHRQLPRDHWARKFTDYGPCWDNYANDLTLSDEVVSYLRSTIDWRPDQEVLIVHSWGYALLTAFSNFLNYWRAFIRKNDDPIIFSLDRPEFVLFGDTGLLAVGRRPITVE